MVVRIVSRGSKLALWQTHSVADALRLADPDLEVEVEVVRTTGDRITDVPLAKIGDKGLFTKELDAALLGHRADLAVHSLKDVPTRIPEGLAIAAVTAREDPRDVLILPIASEGKLSALPPGARIGTSSLRRQAQLRAFRPDLHLLDLRGNLNTRLARLDAGDYDAIILAAAGVHRLGWRDRVSQYLEPPDWLPAVGQGALAVVARSGEPALLERLSCLHDPDTASCTAAERGFLRALEGGCQVPIAALATCRRGTLHLRGLVSSLEGRTALRGETFGEAADAAAIGDRLATDLLQRGAGEILARVRASVGPVVTPAP